MTEKLAYSKHNLRRRIAAATEAGLIITGILADGTVVTADTRVVIDQRRTRQVRVTPNSVGA